MGVRTMQDPPQYYHHSQQITECKKSKFFFNNSHDAQGYCGYDQGHNRIIVATRGTVDLKKWVQDFNFFFMNYRRPGCKVHEGFHNVYEDLANNLLACVCTLDSNHPNSEIYITGHSLGAALSTFAAMEIQETVAPIAQFYNYGCPRVGNKAFAIYLENFLNKVYLARMVHWKDIFQHLPTISMGFSHYGHEIFYTEDNSAFQICGRDDKTCSDQFFWPWQWNIKDTYFIIQAVLAVAQYLVIIIDWYKHQFYLNFNLNIQTLIRDLLTFNHMGLINKSFPQNNFIMRYFICINLDIYLTLEIALSIKYSKF